MVQNGLERINILIIPNSLTLLSRYFSGIILINNNSENIFAKCMQASPLTTYQFGFDLNPKDCFS